MQPTEELGLWVATKAPLVPFNGEWWVHADPTLAPLSKRTFWRSLAALCRDNPLQRARTRVRNVQATLLRGTLTFLKCQNGTFVSITNRSVNTDINTSNIYTHISASFGSVCVCQSSGFSKGDSGEEMKSLDIVKKWKEKQSKGSDSVMASTIEDLIQGTQTKKKVCELWKLLFVFYGHGYAKTLGMKEQASLFAWKTEFWQEFQAPFGLMLQDMLKSYALCCEYVIAHSTWSDYPEIPTLGWLYYNRDVVTKWWVSLHEGDKTYGHKGLQ